MLHSRTLHSDKQHLKEREDKTCGTNDRFKQRHQNNKNKYK